MSQQAVGSRLQDGVLAAKGECVSQATGTKEQVRHHWEQEVCGSRNGTAADRQQYFAQIDLHRYCEDDMLQNFVNFSAAHGKHVLEVGLGTGADLLNWVRAGATAHGRDLTDASVRLVKERLALEGLDADVQRGDAENLDFPDNYFDIYYSWGVLMCTPNPPAAFAEAYRVLKPGGTFKIMLYNANSVTAVLIWLLYGAARLDFRGRGMLYQENVESPGTKIYSPDEARSMLKPIFGDRPLEIHTYLGAGDLLVQKLSDRYPGLKWKVVQALYPRWLVKNVVGDRFGTVMTIHAIK